jgi:hypothetical protein
MRAIQCGSPIHTATLEITHCGLVPLLLLAKPVRSADADGGESMESQANFVERRERPRGGVWAQLQDITFRTLRKYGIVSGLVRERPEIRPTTSEPKGEKTMANLRIIVSNDRPIREEKYPRTWLLYKDNDTIEVHVTHDSHNRPFVLDNGAA